MRICIPIHSFEPGGVERVGLRLAERWQASGHEVTVVLGRDRGATRAQMRAATPNLAYVTRSEPFATEAWETPWLVWNLWTYLRRHPVDVIFCAGNTYTIVCVLAKLLLGRRCPPVVVKISNDLVRPDYSPLMQKLYGVWLRMQGNLLDRFVALSEPMLPQVVAGLAIPPERARAIPDPALRDDEIAEAPVPPPSLDKGRRFLAVARLNRQKNLTLLIEAFALVVRPGDRLTIAGKGPERAIIEKRIAALGLEDCVTLAGHVADVRPLLNASHALVLSSDYEGVPAAVIEALAAGRPIATTDCCASMRWLLQDGAYGALAPLRDAAVLAAAMETAAALDAPREEMHAFSALFTLAKAAPAYLADMQAVAPAAAHGAHISHTPRDRDAPC